MSQDLPVIYRAADFGEADIVVHWLADRRVKAAIKDGHAAATLQVPAIIAPAGIEVYALDPDQVEEARLLLRDHFDAVAAIRAAAQRDPVEASCDDCGQSSTFPGEVRGRVEHCPHCNAYLDVPE